MSQVTFLLPGYEETERVVLEYVPGKRLQQYLHDMKGEGRHVVALRNRCRVTNQNRLPLRMSYVPEPNEVITFRLAPRALS